jgi:hypothetical protein
MKNPLYWSKLHFPILFFLQKFANKKNNVGNYFLVNGQMYGLVMWTYMLFHMKYEGKY